MSKFIIRRVFLALIIIVLGAFIVYAVIRALPSGYVENIARQRATMPNSKSYTEWLAELNRLFRLDTDVFTGFWGWLTDAVRGNFGDSWLYGMSVTKKFADVIWYTVALNIVTFILQMSIAIPLGIMAARKQYSRTDYVITFVALMGISLPSFFLSTLLKFTFAIKLPWFNLYGIVSRNHEQLSAFGKILDMAHNMVLPVTTITLLGIGGLMRFTRTNMLEVLNADYIRTARAKGLSERVVINRHAFRNTLIPLVSYMSYFLPGLFAGSMITETLYQIPGIGYIAYGAMVAGDIPFTMFYSVFLILLTQVSLMVADIMYAVVDPRVRIN